MFESVFEGKTGTHQDDKRPPNGSKPYSKRPKFGKGQN
jgi:hypothetical protein